MAGRAGSVDFGAGVGPGDAAVGAFADVMDGVPPQPSKVEATAARTAQRPGGRRAAAGPQRLRVRMLPAELQLVVDGKFRGVVQEGALATMVGHG